MKKALLIIGIVLIVIAVLLFLAALMWHFAAYGVMDGTADLYHRQIRLMWIHLIAGAAAIIAAVICLILRIRH